MYDVSLKQVYEQFPNEQSAVKVLEGILWAGAPKCPYCGHCRIVQIEGGNRYRCYPCKSNFSVTVGTIFHHTRCDIRKWFIAIHLFSMYRDQLTARGLAEIIEVTKDTAWLILSKIKRFWAENISLFDQISKLIKNK